MSTVTTYPTVFAFDTHAVRSLLLADEPWFVAKDVFAALEIEWKGSDSTGALASLDDDEKGAHVVSTPGGPQEMAVISESGLYTVIFKSRKPEAKRFRKWVTSEVLPAIRRHGSYGSSDNSQLVMMLTALVERIDQRDMQLMAFMTAPQRRRAPERKTPITREHEARAKALYAEGMLISEIGEAIGVSRSAASLLVHDKYPFSIDQRCDA